jgi:alpha-amylase
MLPTDITTTLIGCKLMPEPQPFVLNHDTQTRYERDHAVTAMESWFLPLAYAFILLRSDADLPCVFYGDLYGIRGDSPVPPSCNGNLAKLMLARKLLAYGDMVEYLDQADCVGFTRLGNASHSDGLAVIMANGLETTWKTMNVGDGRQGEEWTDLLGNYNSTVVIPHDGNARFPCAAASVSVWCNGASTDRANIDGLAL